MSYVAASHRGTLRDALAQRCAFRDLEVAVDIGGTPRWWSLSAGPIVEDRKFLGYRGVGSDITQRHRAEEERREALREARHHRRQEEIAEAQNKAKSNILAVMSHEIRTPMNAVIGLSASLSETRLDSEQRHLVDTIHESSNSLLHLLNDILDFSKLEAGKITFEALPFKPAALVGQVADVVDSAAAEKGLSIRTVMDPDLPPAVVGDRTRLRQVLLNLASNAVKFTESGSVEIAARHGGTVGDNACLEFSVRDTGIGIAPGQLDRLFTDFAQGDSSINRRFGGTGLGLAISKRIIEQMGGEIRVESELGRGSMFIVTLGLPHADTVAPEASAASADAIAPATDGPPLSILLAEDNATNQLVFSKLTQSLNVGLTIAANGREALEHAQCGTFDVVFMDMRMPEMDGLAATRAIRALGGAWSTIPIIALTANAFAEDVKSCRDAGMDDFIAKPIRKAVLAQKLGTLRAAGRPAAPVAAPAPMSGEPDPPVIDRASLDSLIEEIERDGVAVSFEAFFADAAERLATLGNLSCDADRVRIRDEAHTLKGAAGTLAFSRLANLARTLEHAAPAITPIVYADLLARMNACFAQTRAEADQAMAA